MADFSDSAYRLSEMKDAITQIWVDKEESPPYELLLCGFRELDIDPSNQVSYRTD